MEWEGGLIVLKGAATQQTIATQQTTVTDASGNYTFAGTADGSYTVTTSLAGYTITPASQAVAVSDAAKPGVNFAATFIGSSISGYVRYMVVQPSGNKPQPAMSGVTMTLTSSTGATKTAVTDSTGKYVFTGLTNGGYILTPGLAGKYFVPSSQAVTVSGANIAMPGYFRSGLNISGNVSSLKVPIEGATVTLTDATGWTTTVVTDRNGNYIAAGYPAISMPYTVKASKVGYAFTPASKAVTTTSDVTGVNFY
jgi:hypothetical protein